MQLRGAPGPRGSSQPSGLLLWGDIPEIWGSSTLPGSAAGFGRALVSARALQKVPQPGRLQADRSRARGVWLQGGNYKQTGHSGPGLAWGRSQELARSHQGGCAPPGSCPVLLHRSPPSKGGLAGKLGSPPSLEPCEGLFWHPGGSRDMLGGTLIHPLPKLLRVITPHQLDPGSPLLGVPQKPKSPKNSMPRAPTPSPAPTPGAPQPPPAR